MGGAYHSRACLCPVKRCAETIQRGGGFREGWLSYKCTVSLAVTSLV